MILARIEIARVQLGSEQTLQHGGQSSRTGLGVAGRDMFGGTNSIAVGYVVAEHDRHILDPRAHGNNAFQDAFGMTETAPGVSILDADQGEGGLDRAEDPVVQPSLRQVGRGNGSDVLEITHVAATFDSGTDLCRRR